MVSWDSREGNFSVVTMRITYAALASQLKFRTPILHMHTNLEMKLDNSEDTLFLSSKAQGQIKNY